MLSQPDNHIEIHDLSFCYQNKPIFTGIDLAIPRGKITAIMGPSGTGKTTLLRLIGGQFHPDKGRVLLNDIDIHRIGRRELYALRRNIGLLFQSSALFTNINVFENVAFSLREHTNLNERLIRHLVLMKLQVVGLRGARDLMPSQLSGGMARRVALARAIALDPELMMYDEPFTGLDPVSLGVICKLVREINQALGLTTIVVSHDVPEVMQIADYAYLISDGKVLAHGTPQDLQKENQPAVKQFIQGLPDGIVPFHYPAKPYAEDLFKYV